MGVMARHNDENDHLLLRNLVADNVIENYSYFKLFIFSIKHVLWVLFICLPTILTVGLVSFGYSLIPWTNSCYYPEKNSTNATSCLYYNKESIVYYDVIIRLVLLATIPVLVSGVSIIGRSNFLKHCLCISFPLILLTFACLPAFLNYEKLWFYNIDVVLFEAMFIVSYSSSLYLISKETEHFNLSTLVSCCVFPGIVGALGVGFVDVYLNREYQLMKDGSLGQYVIRLVVFPIIMDLFIGFSELRIRNIPRNDYNERAHIIYFYQVAFSIVGRYMITTSGNLMQITLMSALVAFKDVILHRVSRFQCWLAYKIKRLVFRCTFCKPDGNHESFTDWFYSDDFRHFRAHILHNELVNELIGIIGAFVVPIIVVTFERHKLLYNFHYERFFDAKGNIDNNYFLQQEAIQLIFIVLTFAIITMIEAKYNRVDLRVVYKDITLVQHVSQVLIYLWGMLLLLSSVRILPNFFQCTINNICSCSFILKKETYGCS